MLRLIFVTLVMAGMLLLARPTSAAADETELRVKLKEEFTRDFLSPKMPADIRERWMEHVLTIIDDDKAPLDETVALAAVNTQAKDDVSAHLRTVYLRLWCFRYRSTPDKLIEFYKKIDEAHRFAMMFMLDMYCRPFLTKAHYPLPQMFFEESIARMAERKRYEDIAMYTEQSRMAVGMMAQTKDPAGPPFVLRMLQTRIADPTQRANVVYAAAAGWREAAAPIVRWYFEEYCWRPHEVKVCLEFFGKYLDPVEVSSLIELKRKGLAGALGALDRTAADTGAQNEDQEKKSVEQPDVMQPGAD